VSTSAQVESRWCREAATIEVSIWRPCCFKGEEGREAEVNYFAGFVPSIKLVLDMDVIKICVDDSVKDVGF
jgi:hypothetical protein